MANPNPVLLEAEAEKSLDRSISVDQRAEKQVDEQAGQYASQTFTSRGDANSINGYDGYDSDGKPWHDGVLRIRAITAMWSKKSMWIMFAL